MVLANADMTEIYQWEPTNSAEVVAFVLHVKTLVDQTGTLTLTGAGVATTTDHAVDAGNVAWIFALPQPTITHVIATPVTTDHAVNAGEVAWAFVIPQPTVTHVVVSIPDFLTYLWTSSAGGVFTNATLKDTTWTAPDVSQETVVTLTLLVTDSGGLTDTDSVDVTVQNIVSTTDHAVDAGAVSWAFAVPQPSVTHTPAGTASVTVALTAYGSGNTGVFWDPNVDLGDTFSADGAIHALNQVVLTHSGVNAGRVYINISNSSGFTPAFEASGRIIFEASDGETLEVRIANADMTEPYNWLPPNSAEVIAFALHVRDLTDHNATLTLTLASVDHAVDAGNVAWTFDLPQPSFTHTPGPPGLTDHAVDAVFPYTPGNASLQGTLPSGLPSPAGMTWDGQQLVIQNIAGDEIWTLARNANGTYTPGNASLQGTLPASLDAPQSLAWDGQQLVIGLDTGDEIWTLARNADDSYTPLNASLQGDPACQPAPPHTGLAWDGQQLVIADSAGDETWTLARNADDSYTPGNASLQGTLPASFDAPIGMTWDGQKLALIDVPNDKIWTLGSECGRLIHTRERQPPRHPAFRHLLATKSGLGWTAARHRRFRWRRDMDAGSRLGSFMGL